MERIVVETQIRGNTWYHKVDSFPATIGRALDNDIILSDLSVSPHHMRIEKTEDEQITVINISDENGTIINKEKMVEGQGQNITLPTRLELGHSKIRLLSPDTPVEPTRLWECSGIFCLLTNKIWAGLLTILLLGLFVFDHYLVSPMNRPLAHYVNESFSSVLYLVGFFLVIAGISRLATHRWDLTPALSMAALFFLVPKLVGYAGELVNYYFSNDKFTDILLYALDILLLPLLLVLFMTRIAHSALWPSIGVALLVSSPFIGLKAKDLSHELARPDFSQLPKYNKTLSAFDIRDQQSASVVDFLEQADQYLGEQMQQELENEELN